MDTKKIDAMIAECGITLPDDAKLRFMFRRAVHHAYLTGCKSGMETQRKIDKMVRDWELYRIGSNIDATA